MGYICIKKLTLGGVEYRPGDTIPDDAFAEGRAGKLKSYGYIAEQGGGEAPDMNVGNMVPTAEVFPAGLPDDTIPIDLSDCGPQFADSIPVVLEKPKEGQEPVGFAISGDQLQTIVDIMQKNATDAAAAIAEEVDETVLTFIAKVDSRKTVYQAAQKQLATIASLMGGSDIPATAESTEAAGE